MRPAPTRPRCYLASIDPLPPLRERIPLAEEAARYGPPPARARNCVPELSRGMYPAVALINYARELTAGPDGVRISLGGLGANLEPSTRSIQSHTRQKTSYRL